MRTGFRYRMYRKYSMVSELRQLKTRLTAILAKIPGAYAQIIDDVRAPPKVRLDAMRDLMDRLGLPAVKAQLTQTMSTTLNGAALLDSRRQVSARRSELEGEMVKIRAQLEAKEVCGAAHAQGEEDQEGNEEAVLQGKGGESLLRLYQQGDGQGGGEKEAPQETQEVADGRTPGRLDVPVQEGNA